MTYDSLLLEALPYPATLIDAEGLIVDVNTAFLTLARQVGREFRKEERIGYPVEQFASTAEARQRLTELLENLRRRGAPQRCRWGLVAASGEVVHRELEARPLPEASGRLTGVLLLWEALGTPRWQERLRASQERLWKACWTMRGTAPISRACCRPCIRLFPQIEHCSVQLFQEDNELWQASSGRNKPVAIGVRWRPERAVEICRQEQRPVYRPDLSQEDPYGEAARIWQGYSPAVRAVLDVPLPQGTLAVNSYRPQAFSLEEISTLTHLAHGLAAGLARLAELQSQARYRALDVRGLPEEPGVRDILWRLGREAALVWRMVQLAQELERQAPAVEALLQESVRPSSEEERWPEF